MHAQQSRRVLVATAPTRLDFGGGWTDVPPYPEDRGGFVCSVAITRFATARVRTAGSDEIDAGDADVAPAIVKAALARHGVRALVTLSSDYPIGAGLGGSSAAGVALTAALRALGNHDVESREARDLIAETSRAIEVEELGLAGGRQDHYAAAHGGALGIEFGRDTVAHRIELSDETTRDLESRCIVGYTGQSRISGTTITAVLDAYLNGVPRVLDALAGMKSLALRMRDALANGDVDELAALVREHWRHQRSLHPGITTPRIDALENDVRSAGALGMKALGASGGGCVMVFADRRNISLVRDTVARHAELLPWRVARQGVTVHEESA